MVKYLVFILYFVSFSLFCQENDYEDIPYSQKQVDSLKTLLSDNTSADDFHILAGIAMNETNPDEKIHYSDLLINEAKKLNYINFIKIGYLQKGNALQLQGEYHEALSAYFECLEWAKKQNKNNNIKNILVSIADTYSMIGNSASAEKYYDQAIAELRESLKVAEDSLNLATALLNAGDEYYKTEQYDKALHNFAESGEIFELLDFQIGKAYNIGNTGMVYAKQGKDELAIKNMNEAITILEENEDYYAISEFLNYMSDLYQEQNDFDTALAYTNRSIELSEKYNLKDQISNAYLQLFELMRNSGDYEKALDSYITHDIYQDSILNLENVQKMANLEVGKSNAELEAETQKRKTQRIILWSIAGVLLLIGILAYSLFKQNKFVKKTNKVIALEKERSDNLLLNILPEETAQELKEKGRVEAKKYNTVSVFFSDFKGFTKYAENLSPEVLVRTVDHYFSEFDRIIERHGLEKIKTIGDAYMAAGGLNDVDGNHAKTMVLAAQEMIDFVAKAKEDTITDATFDIRIGINTGPVVAGVVGSKKFAYDIWGDTVNVAARMESNSQPGRINISEDTYNLIKDDFDCEFRGKLAVKNRGELNMYFVNN